MKTNDVQIVKDNVLIANFMEWEQCEYIERVTNSKHPDYKKKQPPIKAFCLTEEHPMVKDLYTDIPGYHWDYNKVDEFENTINRLVFFYEDLKFNSSWEWLMPVIHRIIKTIGVRSIDECSEVEWFVSTRITQMYIGINIEHAHYYCVEFIHWYNKQQKQS